MIVRDATANKHLLFSVDKQFDLFPHKQFYVANVTGPFNKY